MGGRKGRRERYRRIVIGMAIESQIVVLTCSNVEIKRQTINSSYTLRNELTSAVASTVYPPQVVPDLSRMSVFPTPYIVFPDWPTIANCLGNTSEICLFALVVRANATGPLPFGKTFTSAFLSFENC
jgi:hypothetical protein